MVSRWDVLKVSLLITPRLASTWVTVGIVATVPCVLGIARRGFPTTLRASFVEFAAFALVAIAMLSLMLLFITGFVLLSPGHGILGEHVYSVESDGVREQTVANDTLIKWGGAQNLVRTSTFILIRIAPALFHLVPRRSFSSQAEYDEFWEGIQALERGPRPTQA